ncbi:hypothetical protein [Klebsiella pneumoniae]|uniref:hypothetical protein n=1 Tax=Klebsiella pneumoniae TaxID=573 RepID=UPI004055750C
MRRKIISVREKLIEYRRVRNECGVTVQAAKKKTWEEFGRSLDEDHRDNIKRFWRTIKILKGKYKKPFRNIKDQNGNILSETNGILDRWKTHFEELFKKEDYAVPELIVNDNTSQESIEEEEIADAIEKMKVGKAPGRDGIAPEFIKYGGQELVKVLQGLFQETWNSGIVPEDWNFSVIIPIHKKGSTTECGNYRPISLLSVVYKIYTSILEKRLRRMVEEQLEPDKYD